MKNPLEPRRLETTARCASRGEFRDDGYVVSLLAEGLDGCEAHITLTGTDNVPREAPQPRWGCSDEEWEAASQRLQQRSLLDESSLLTPAGIALRQAVEDRTDLLVLPPWQHLGKERYTRLLSLVRPISISIVDQGRIPTPNPMGVPRH